MAKHTPWVKLMLSRRHMFALAEVITQWAYFETAFDRCHLWMRADRRAMELAPDIPSSFSRRLKLFRKSSRVCFGSCAPLLVRIGAIATDAGRLKRTRDDIAHGTWVGSPKDGWLAIEVLDMRGPKPKSTGYEVTSEFLRETAYQISALSRRVMAVTNAGTVIGQDYSFPIPEPELSALREFRTKHQTAPKPPRFAHTSPLSAAQVAMWENLVEQMGEKKGRAS